ncbi:MAG: hypothetical protein K2L05_08930 [Muribaculaceae bacterium]|nr:hypothetical protein [Muribaculaceae bacterium]
MGLRKIRFISVILAILLALTFEGCSGGRRRDRNRERSRERTEQRESRNRSRHERNATSRKAAYSAEEIQEIAESGDYDRMLDCVQSEISDLKAMKNRYFNGELTDKQAEEQTKKIKETYAPVYNAIGRASSDGNLNYKQHKRQMKLFGEYMKLMTSVLDRLGSDFEDAVGCRVFD